MPTAIIETDISQSPGFYGKCPQQGDFVSRRLPGTFIDPVDSWLQEGIHFAKNEWAEQWLDYYLTSPIWHFVISDGLCGKESWSGTLMPSVDSVGRYFPLMVATKLPPNSNPFALLNGAKKWFDAIQQVLLSTLEEPAPALAQWDSELAKVGAPMGEFARRYSAEKTGFGHSWQIPFFSPNLESSFAEVLDCFVSYRFAKYCLWWSQGSERVEPCVLINQDLPNARHYCGLLSGEWGAFGWETW